MKIYPTITTLTNDYINKLEEVKKFKLEKVCLFLTGLNKEQRKELYSKLTIKEVPLCHIRNDMDLDEINFLIKKFNVQKLNTHAGHTHPFEYDLSPIKDKLYIENNHIEITEKDIKNWAGICLDVSHLENDRLTNIGMYDRQMELLSKNTIGCNHISVILKEPYLNEEIHTIRHDAHMSHDLSDFDYLKKYIKLNMLSDFCAMEIENSIEYQLKAIEYINEKLS